MERRHFSPIDNYLLSIPPTDEELWRTGLQVLYDSMKHSVADPLSIDEQWFDVHDEHGDNINQGFRIPESYVIVGARKIVWADFLPKFVDSHQRFFNLVEGLHPDYKISPEERRKTALEIPQTYKTLIEIIKQTHDLKFTASEDALSKLTKEFRLRELVETNVKRELDKPCFRYPHIEQGLPSRAHALAVGSYHILRERTEALSGSQFQFIPADQEYFESMYPGSLSSYKGRIRFVRETFDKIDLTQARVETMLALLLDNQ